MISLLRTAGARRGGSRLLVLANAAVGRLVRMGAAPRDCRELLVVGRVSGRLAARPVNVLHVDGARFLLSPRGQTQWVRNVRAGGAVSLRRAGRTERVVLVELDDARKPELIRAYLRKWGWQVADLVEVTAASSDGEILAAASALPVFEIRSPA